MRKLKCVRGFSGCLIVLVTLVAMQSQAATVTWSGTGTTSLSDPANWSSVPTSANNTDMVFNNTTNTAGLVHDINAGTMLFNSINFGTLATTSFNIGGGTFGVDNGATVSNASTADHTISSNFIENTANNTLTLTGNGPGMVILTGNLLEGSGRTLAITKSGNSTFILAPTAANTQTGAVNVNGGVLEANSGDGIGANNQLTLTGGVLQSHGPDAVIFTRQIGLGAGSVNFNGGGFAARGNTMTIRLGDSTTAVVWGSFSGLNSVFNALGTALTLNSNTADNMVDWQNDINLTSPLGGNTARTITVNDNPAVNTDFARISGVISATNTNPLTKNGAGRLELTRVNTYTALTTVNAGTLAIMNTGSLASSVQVDSGAHFDVSDFSSGYTFNGGRTLSGRGQVDGKLTISGTGTISPGTGTGLGTLSSSGDQTWDTGGTYKWEINNATGTAGTNFDQIKITGALHATSAFTIKITSLNAAGTGAGSISNFDKNLAYAWIIATTTGGVNPSPDAPFDASLFTLDKTAFQNSITGTLGTGFYLDVIGNDLVLHYDGVPEPASLGVLLLGTFGLLRRRPKRKCA